MYSEQARKGPLSLAISDPRAISSFFPLAMLAESLGISSRTAFQAAPYGVSSLTKSSDSAENLPTNSYEELEIDAETLQDLKGILVGD